MKFALTSISALAMMSAAAMAAPHPKDHSGNARQTVVVPVGHVQRGSLQNGANRLNTKDGYLSTERRPFNVDKGYVATGLIAGTTAAIIAAAATPSGREFTTRHYRNAKDQAANGLRSVGRFAKNTFSKAEQEVGAVKTKIEDAANDAANKAGKLVGKAQKVEKNVEEDVKAGVDGAANAAANTAKSAANTAGNAIGEAQEVGSNMEKEFKQGKIQGKAQADTTIPTTPAPAVSDQTTVPVVPVGPVVPVVPVATEGAQTKPSN